MSFLKIFRKIDEKFFDFPKKPKKVYKSVEKFI